MSIYRFEPAEPLDDQCRRIMRRQLKAAGKALEAESQSAATIHRARRCLKRCRSLISLIDPEGDKRRWSAEDSALRDIARALSGARDVQAKLDALGRLESRAADQSLGPSFTRLRKGIDARGRAAKQNVAGDVPAAIVSRLGEIAEQFTRKRLRGFGEAQAVRGTAATYRRGRKAMARAIRSGRDEDYHAWRKHLQRHWRHMQLLEAAWPQEMAGRAAAAKELSALLGDDHDLAMLLGYLREATVPLAQSKRQQLAELGRELQSELRRRAEIAGRRLYAEKSRALARRLTTYWSVAIAFGDSGKPAAPQAIEAPEDAAPAIEESVPIAADAGTVT
jgi:hypothetical protein